QQLAVAGEEARLLEVQVGDQQRRLARPVERAGLGEDKFLAAEVERERKGNHALPLPRRGGFGKGTRPLIFVIARSAATKQSRAALRSPGLPCDLRSLAMTKDNMTDWQPYTARAREWFESLRDRICAEFEAIEREAGSDASFEYTPWRREEEGNADPGGGVRGVMEGQVFEKVGVNVSTVSGTFAPEFAHTIHGTEDN